MPWQTEQSEIKGLPIQATEEHEPEMVFFQTPSAFKKSPTDQFLSLLDDTINKKLDWSHDLLFFSPLTVDLNLQGEVPMETKVSLGGREQNQEESEENMDKGNIMMEEDEKEIIKTPKTLPVSLQEKRTQLQKLSPIQKQKSQQNKIKCNCRKTHCLKMYCECFRAGQTCGDDCDCCGCENEVQNSRKRSKAIMNIINKDHTAFLEKVKYRGCNCTKTECRKKYCECYAQGLICGKDCRCLNCKNSCRKVKKSEKRRK